MTRPPAEPGANRPRGLLHSAWFSLALGLAALVVVEGGHLDRLWDDRLVRGLPGPGNALRLRGEHRGRVDVQCQRLIHSAGRHHHGRQDHR